jgi:hypothetical protein
VSRDAVQQLGNELEGRLELVERTLKRFGVERWKVTLIVRGDLEGEWVVMTKDDLRVVARRLSVAVEQQGQPKKSDRCGRCGLARGFHGPVLAQEGDPQCDGFVEREPDGAARIAAERRRQVEAEGWTFDHDDQHTDGKLAQAAACYAVATVPMYAGHFPVIWPWSPRWDKRPGKSADVAARIRALEKAGALCAAEIDRLQRLRASGGAP